ncbi:MAG: hypothetical protein M3Y72_23270 [Acidobacteriota bacterium]|nr:hypothetical protein [Acidobacteriota bacterium]
MKEKLYEGFLDIPTFSEFSDKRFEELVLELIRAENELGKIHRLGPSPLSQAGYDIQATLNDGTQVCCECKQRLGRFGGTDISEAVNRFLDGSKVSWAHQFWLITSGLRSRNSEEADQLATEKLNQLGKEFVYVPREELWARLKFRPSLVSIFFSEPWKQVSQAWVRDQLAESDEQERRTQVRKLFSQGNVDKYEDGYFSLTFLLPDVGTTRTTALIKFNTDGLQRALITLDDDDILDVFDEPMWENEKPWMAAEYRGRTWAQIGNVRVELSNEMFADLGSHLRIVRSRWLERVTAQDRDIEAEGYQHIDGEHAKLGRIQAGMWHQMILFAEDHDAEKGSSEWHIFDASQTMLKVWTNETTPVMDRGYHVILSTRPSVHYTTEDAAMVDLIWHRPFHLHKKLTARGVRGRWGCETTVRWLEAEFIPHIISRALPRSRPTWSHQFFRRASRQSPIVPSIQDFFYVTKSRDWSMLPVESRDSLVTMLSDLQTHFLLRHEARYPPSFPKAVDRALLMILASAPGPQSAYIAGKIGIEASDSKEELIRQLNARLRKRYDRADGALLDWLLSAALVMVRDDDADFLNSAECQTVADTLDELAKSAALYNCLIAHRLIPEGLYLS